MSEDGAPPKSGWMKITCELHVEDITTSCAFWIGVLGFEIAYQRREEKFVYLERSEGAQIMLCQRNGRWETGAMERPFGRGVMFQIDVESLDPILANLDAGNWAIYKGLYEVWRRHGDREGGRREVVVQDPDGYLVMLCDDLGERPIPEK
ncbi:MAG: bleomycin resistance family protein [Hyphomicrobiales bacterium]|nr:MAG: bleomycin resistance family protein [Hyphomicrobiales bacterium]